jgi:hypothetical protein
MLGTNHAITIHLIEILPVLAIGFVSFMGLGLLLGAKLAQKKKINDYLIVVFAYAFAALIGYIDFYIYLISTNDGWHIGGGIGVFLITLNVLSLGYALLFNEGLRAILLRRAVWMPVILVLIVGTLYIGVLDSCTVHTPPQKEYYCLLPDTAQPSQILQKKIVFDTFDSLIPYYFATNVESGHARLEYGDWKSSDRPPLQTGMYLAYNSGIYWSTRDAFSSYLMLSMLLQLVCIPALWAFLRVLKCSEKQISIVLFALIFTDFFFNNVYFTWPKLLAAGLFLLGFSLLLEKKPLTVLRSIIIGGSLALAYLAHSGVAFSLAPLLIFTIPRIGGLFKLKYLVFIAATALLLIVPWSVYQKYYDPPGNRLLKWQFAGVIDIDNNSVLHDVVHAYEPFTPRTYAEYKWQDVEMILGMVRVHDSGFQKDRQVDTFSGAGGLMILALVGLIFIRRRQNTKGRQAIKQLSFYILTTLAFWVILMFLPASTSLHQGSYVTPVMFIALLGIAASFLPAFCIGMLLAAQVVLFFLTWIFYKGYYAGTYSVHNSYALIAVMFLTLLIAGLLFVPLLKHKKVPQLAVLRK